MENLQTTTVSAQTSSETVWQWRSKRWKNALIILAVILVAGSLVIRFSADDSQDWNYNFNVTVLILFAIWTVFYEREWPVWKRVLWIPGLWLAHGFIFILVGIITGRLGLGSVFDATIVTLILVTLTMRRSTYFVEPAPPGANKSWLKWLW